MEGQRPVKRGGNDDSWRASGRKKMCKRDQNAEGEEEEALKDYKKMQKDLKDALGKAAEKLSQFLSTHSMPETRKGIEYLKNRLTGLKPDSLLDPIYIGVFGSTGAGKTTLLNAIMEKKLFLPVSGSKACTSCVVQVNTSQSKQHEAKIHLLTDEEWKDELKGLVALVNVDEDETTDDERQEALLKISTIYGEGATTRSYEELCRMKPIVHIPSSRCITLKEAKEADFSEKMGLYVRIQSIFDGENAGTSEENGKAQLWPLIKNVEVTIPRLQVVPEGVTFVDIPGTGDFNSKRDAMWKENINKCSVIWVVNSIERIQGEKTHEMLLREGMKAFQCGMCKDISLVVTKSDQMDVEEYKWEKKKDNINKHDAILERNQSVKENKKEMMKKNLARKLPSDCEVLHKADLVYTTSAREYWNGEILSKEETEIPKLRDYIQTFYRAQKRNILMDYVTEALVIFSLIQNTQTNQQAQYPCVKEIHLEKLIMEKINVLEERIGECFESIEQPLSEGVDEAKKLCKKSMDKILNRDRGYRGFHRTLKAVCLNNGVYASRTFHRIDINYSLAQPIYEKIDMNFGNVFRIQMGASCTLKACLDMFKNGMQQQLQEAMQNSEADITHKFLQQETDFIIRDTEKLILQKKAEIYQSLTVSIQNSLQPFYKVAASHRGAQAYRRMQNTLNKGIEGELETGMFEKAHASLRKHFQVLKEEIINNVKSNFSDTLRLAFFPWYQLNKALPDFQDELSCIYTIHENLRSARDP